MTAKRKPTTEDGEGNGKLVLEYGKFNQSIRYAILIAALSATPFGQQVLKNMGISSPAVESVTAVQTKVDKTGADVDELKKDFADLKEKVAGLDAKVQTIVTGFQIDFQRYRPGTENNKSAQ